MNDFSFISCYYKNNLSLKVSEEIQNKINTILADKYSFVYDEIEYGNALIPKHWKILYKKFSPSFIFIANINNKEYYGVCGKQSNLIQYILTRFVIDFQGNIFIRKMYPMHQNNIFIRKIYPSHLINANLDDKNLLVCPDQFIFNLNDHNEPKQS